MASPWHNPTDLATSVAHRRDTLLLQVRQVTLGLLRVSWQKCRMKASCQMFLLTLAWSRLARFVAVNGSLALNTCRPWRGWVSHLPDFRLWEIANTQVLKTSHCVTIVVPWNYLNPHFKLPGPSLSCTLRTSRSWLAYLDMASSGWLSDFDMDARSSVKFVHPKSFKWLITTLLAVSLEARRGSFDGSNETSLQASSQT